MSVRISRDYINNILHAAAQHPEEEVCGLLLGRADSARGGWDVLDILPVANMAVSPDKYFELDPVTHLQAQRLARGRGMHIIGHYHSHPSGITQPSVADAARAFGDGALWLICSAFGGFHFWCATGEGLHDQFQPVVAEII